MLGFPNQMLHYAGPYPIALIIWKNEDLINLNGIRFCFC